MATTDTRPSTIDVTTIEQSQGGDDACVACSHPWSAHDVISARFCTATAAGALDRRCVCPHE
ncbi:MAG TPA: RGCVC family protein [Pseudonocardiaceae bacterium]|nr:RGCVC family protein [Pseudonocardiaceae bacterium]